MKTKDIFYRSDTTPEHTCRQTKTTVKRSAISENKKIIIFLIALLGLIIFPQIVFSQATVSTDKFNYYPGETVNISGTNWQAGETVRLVLVESPAPDPNDTLYAVADGGGNIFNNGYVIQPDDIGQSFTLTATGLSSGYTVQAYFIDGVDFRQSANNDAGYGLGNVHWINSILQQSNSKYYEGMSSLQRVILMDIATTSGNVHTLTFRHQSVKSSAGAHAYDFLTSWPQAQAAANAIAPGQGLFDNLNECGAEPSSDPGGILTLCTALHTSGFFATPSIPDAMGSTLGDNVAARVAAYESQFGDRTLKLYGDAAITSASVTFHGYSGSDLDAAYTLTWTSASENIVIEFAGHLGVGQDPLLAGIGYGVGKGSGAIPGGPYHINLDLLDGHSLGNQDNQIKAADILIPAPLCTITGPAESCTGASNLSYSANAGTGLSYSWSLDPANGAVIVGSSTSVNVEVSIAASTGNFTLKLTVTGPGGSTLCDKIVSIHPLPSCAINGALNSGGTSDITCNSPGGSPDNTISTSNVQAGNSYAWSFLSPPAGWSITGGQGTSQITFTSGECPLTSVTVQLIVTDSNGCVDTCTSSITPVPFRTQCDADAGDPKHLDCSVTSVVLNGSTLTPSTTFDNGDSLASTYSWAGPGIVSGGSTLTPTVNEPGQYILTVTVAPGTGVESSCQDSVLVTQDTVGPVCSITGIDPTCLVSSNNYSGPDAPVGKTYLYSWSLSGAVNASISGSTSGKTVTVVSSSPCNASYTLNLIVTDSVNGCQSSCNESYGFRDATAPDISAAGADTTINCPAVPVFTAPTGSDLCDANPDIVLVSDTTIGNACSYVRTKTWKAVDACGNESGLVSQSITVHDVTAPLIGAAGADTTINCPSEPQFTAPTGSDECSQYQIVLVNDTTIGNACSYVRTKTWKAVDDCGNESGLVSQSITVHDVTAPLIGVAGADTTINCPSEPQFTAPTGSDECSQYQIVLVNDTTIGNACSYVRTKTWKAVDDCGNESGLVSQSITVHDVTAPLIGAAGADTTINCPSEPQFTAPTGSDECSRYDIVLVNDTTIGNACSYVRTKTWKAVDACGNESGLVSQSITVHDVTDPSIGAAGADTTLECYTLPLVFTEPTGSDLCDVNPDIVLVSDTTIGSSCNYVRTKTWKAVDACGNESGLVSQAITVRDITAPTLSGEGSDILLSHCAAEVEFTAPVASDDCDPNPDVNIVRTDTVANSDGSVSYTRIWSAVDDCENVSSEVDQTITRPACVGEFCSLTQGFYGQSNGKGKSCATGETALQMITRLLGADYGNLVIGKPGRSLTITQSRAECIIRRLPAGGPSVALPSGNQTFDAGCNTTIPLKNGKFNNTLLGQTITLGLNMRLDKDLEDLVLAGTTMITIGSSNGPDGMCGTSDDGVNGVTTTKYIPASVLAALNINYGSATVVNLFDLANRALGGLSTYGATLSEINQAVSAINEGFDNCKFLSGFSSERESAQMEEPQNKSVTEDLAMKAYPNPFDNSSTIEFTSKIDAMLSVEIYSVTGAKVASLFNGNVKAGETNLVVFKAGDLPNGSYICKIMSDNRVYVERLVLIR